MAVASSQGSVQALALGMPKLARMPESALVIPVAQPSSSCTPRSVHTTTGVHHERVPYVPPGFGRCNSIHAVSLYRPIWCHVIFDNCPRFGTICNGLGTFLPSRCRLLSHHLELSETLPFTLLLGLTPILYGKSYCNDSRRDDDNSVPKCYLGLVCQGYL